MNFNPRLREGGDASGSTALCVDTGISIHASEKEATPRKSTRHTRDLFQSTPPRRRRRFLFSNSGIKYKISIHASEKEATDTVDFAAFRPLISIHASEKEATI